MFVVSDDEAEPLQRSKRPRSVSRTVCVALVADESLQPKVAKSHLEAMQRHAPQISLGRGAFLLGVVLLQWCVLCLDLGGGIDGRMLVRNPGIRAHANSHCLEYEILDAAWLNEPLAYDGVLPPVVYNLLPGHHVEGTYCCWAPTAFAATAGNLKWLLSLHFSPSCKCLHGAPANTPSMPAVPKGQTPPPLRSPQTPSPDRPKTACRKKMFVFDRMQKRKIPCGMAAETKIPCGMAAEWLRKRKIPCGMAAKTKTGFGKR